LRKLIIFVTLSITSLFAFGDSKFDIDEKMYQAFLLSTQKEFNKSQEAYKALLVHKSNMNLNQKANIYKSLLELSYILDDPNGALTYGNDLIDLIHDKPDYSEALERIKYRICLSEDWAKFRHLFKQQCG